MHPGAQTSGHAPGQVWLTNNDSKKKKHLAHIALDLIVLHVSSRSDTVYLSKSSVTI